MKLSKPNGVLTKKYVMNNGHSVTVKDYTGLRYVNEVRQMK